MKEVVLLILDGWGISNSEKNAIKTAHTPNFDRYLNEFPNSVLKTSGEAAGLPNGFQGNSEVGHLNIGAGRVVYQSLARINKEIKEETFFENKTFLEAIENCKKNNSNLHLMGLIQDEGVHALTEHCIAILKLCKEKNFERVFVHVFTDGRDTPPKSAEKYIYQLQEGVNMYTGKIASICGRYYSMDRDNRWDRVEEAYNLIVKGRGEKFETWQNALNDAYENGESDEFIKPRITKDFEKIKDNDSVVFFNYRLDRARELTHSFLDDNFNHFNREKKNVFFVAFSEYYAEIKENRNARIAFEEEDMSNLLGEIISKKGIPQLRLAETEKYAHVTFFFNGKNEQPYEKEDRILVDSPKVATYDLKPEMSAYQVKEKAIEAINNKDYGLIVINFANPDMVGHTGKFDAAVKACEVVDECVGEIVEASKKKKKTVLIIADHGNCEDM